MLCDQQEALFPAAPVYSAPVPESTLRPPAAAKGVDPTIHGKCRQFLPQVRMSMPGEQMGGRLGVSLRLLSGRRPGCTPFVGVVGRRGRKRSNLGRALDAAPVVIYSRSICDTVGVD